MLNLSKVVSQLRICRSTPVRSIPIYSANLATFKESWFFGCPVPKTPFLDTQARHDVILNFTPIIRFNSLRIFYFKMATSEGGGGGLHIRSWDRALSEMVISIQIWLGLTRFRKYFSVCMFLTDSRIHA